MPAVQPPQHTSPDFLPAAGERDRVAGWRRAILEALGVRSVEQGEACQGSGQAPAALPRDPAAASAPPEPGLRPTPEAPPAGAKPHPAPLPQPRSRSRVAAYAGALAVLLGAAYIGFFAFRLDRSFPALAWRLPWPVAYAGGDIVTWRELMSTARTMELFYDQVGAGAPGPSDSELVQQAFRTWLEARVVARELRQRNLAVPAEAVEAEYRNLLQSFGEAAALEEFLVRSYRLSSQQFKVQVLRPLLERAQLEQGLSGDAQAVAQAQQRAQSLRARLAAGEVSFTEAARRESDDTATAHLGGDLGWFALDQARPELARALEALAPGEVSQPVRTELGYHLLMLEQAVAGEGGGGSRTVHAFHILLKPVALDDWLEARLADVRIVRFMPL